jgi:hypothetical protein
MTALPATFLYTRLLAQFRRAQAKGDRAAMLILASRLNALGRAS